MMMIILNKMFSFDRHELQVDFNSKTLLIYLARFQKKAFSIGPKFQSPISFLLVVMKAGSKCRQLPDETNTDF